jgi:histidinol-phosphatase (PHP family)
MVAAMTSSPAPGIAAGFGNFHTHTRHCDGRGEVRDFAEAAIRRGMPRIGFSGHNVVPFPAAWTMPAANLPGYIADVRDAKEMFAGRLEVYLGMEVDYIPGVASPRDPAIRALGLDYVIGSVHFLCPVDGAWDWTVDGSPAELAHGIARCYAGSARRMAEAYYARVAEMLLQAAPDVVGHFDLLKKHNRKGELFSEDEPWYRHAALAALEAVARSGSILEVNTGGVMRNTSGALYPSPWILREALALGVPVVVTADAHRPEHLDGHFAETVALLRDIGFRGQRQLTPRGWIDTQL